MKHFGDITKINGHAVPIVDIITGGSPCQDLSVAGKREGLKKKCHNYITCGFEIDAKSELDRCPWCGSYLDLTRSGLFMEQIRIIKEMHDECRRANVDIRPRYMVWENVPGAFSSNGGADFHAVLEETAKVAERDASIPRLEKWPQSGAIMGNGWSIAWRVHDAQFWGVPQRRKRIALVADFRGGGAPEILFERKGVSGDTPASGKAREEAAGDTGESAEKTSVCFGMSPYDSNAMKSDNPNSGIYKADTTRTLDLNGGNPACNQGGMMVVEGVDGYNQTTTGAKSMSLTSGRADDHHIPCVVIEGNGSRPSHRGDGYAESDTMYTLNSTEKHAVMTQQAFGEYKAGGAASSLKMRDYKDATDLVVTKIES